MATYSANTTIEINTSVGVTNGSYSTGAGQYAIVHLIWSGVGAGASFTLDGITVTLANAVGASFTVTNGIYGPIHIGPGKTISSTNGGSGSHRITGVEFDNTP